ncbi:hypothetical protein [Candidatus Ruminimicrobium bovinum]|uniref:hypothetical protein n=1 Tax=Candidatus Ruminimicrobium bovinum TaxID=3242779 RepID=UPI0039B9A88C
MKNKRFLLSKFYKNYKSVIFDNEGNKKKLKEIVNKLLPYIMENENLEKIIINKFYYCLKGFKEGITKEKMKSGIKNCIYIFGDEILGKLSKKYISDDEINTYLFPLINELNLQNIIACVGGI